MVTARGTWLVGVCLHRVTLTGSVLYGELKDLELFDPSGDLVSCGHETLQSSMISVNGQKRMRLKWFTMSITANSSLHMTNSLDLSKVQLW